MNIGSLLKEIFNEGARVLYNPRKHWIMVKHDRDAFSGVFTKFLVPSLILVFFSVIVGDLMFESEYGWIIQDSLIKAAILLI